MEHVPMHVNACHDDCHKIATQPVILWFREKWFPLNFDYHDEMHTVPFAQLSNVPEKGVWFVLHSIANKLPVKKQIFSVTFLQFQEMHV